MTIQQSLKLRKKVERQINKEAERIFQYNTTESRETKKYSTKGCLENYIQLSEELVKIKTAIHKATINIVESKFRLATLKELVYTVENLGCVSGEWSDERTKEKIIYTSEITKDEKFSLIAKYEIEIEKLEEEIDVFYNSNQLIV